MFHESLNVRHFFFKVRPLVFLRHTVLCFSVKAVYRFAQLLAYLLQYVYRYLGIGSGTGMGGVHYYFLRLDETIVNGYLHALPDELVQHQQATIAQPLLAELAQSARIYDIGFRSKTEEP